MRRFHVLAALFSMAAVIPVFGQSISLTRSPGGAVRVGDTITVSVEVAPGTTAVRGGGAEIAFPSSVFELLDGPSSGNAGAAVTRAVGGNPYTNAAPPAWLIPEGGTSRLLLPIVPPTAQLASTNSFSGTVATFRLRAKAQSAAARLDVTANSRLVPSANATTTSDLEFPVLAGATVTAPGDISCPLDGRINSNDAVAILRFSVEIPGAFDCFNQNCATTPACWFPGAADVNADGVCDTRDALAILRAYARPGSSPGPGGIDAPCPCGAGTKAVGDAKSVPVDPLHLISIETGGARPGDEISIAVVADSAETVEDFRIAVEFDPTVFTFVDHSGTSSGLMAVNSLEVGKIKLAGARTGSAARDRTLATLHLRVRPEAAAGTYGLAFNTDYTRINGRTGTAATSAGAIAVEANSRVSDWPRFADR